MNFWKKFWDWYDRHYVLNLSIAAGLFIIQLIHLYWLSADVVALRLVNKSFFHLTGIWEIIILLVDYTEIPALITTSLIYINALRKKFSLKSILFLIFLNSQWLHIFWITDEFVVDSFTGSGPGTLLPFWLAWIAIGIDYLELPVIFDTVKNLFDALKKKDTKKISGAFKKQ